MTIIVRESVRGGKYDEGFFESAVRKIREAVNVFKGMAEKGRGS